MWVHISQTADNGTWLAGIARGLRWNELKFTHMLPHIDISVFPSMSRAAGGSIRSLPIEVSTK
jgi:hypothetical protein